MVSKEVKVFEYINGKRTNGYLKLFTTDDGTSNEVYVMIEPNIDGEHGPTLRLRIDDICEALDVFNNTRSVRYIPRSYARRDGGDD